MDNQELEQKLLDLETKQEDGHQEVLSSISTNAEELRGVKSEVSRLLDSDDRNKEFSDSLASLEEHVGSLKIDIRSLRVIDSEASSSRLIFEDRVKKLEEIVSELTKELQAALNELAKEIRAAAKELASKEI